MQDKSYKISLTKKKSFKTALFLIAGTTVLGSTIIAPSLPELQRHFLYIGSSVELLSRLILTLPALFILLFSPLAGFLYEKFSRLKIIYPALITWSIAGGCGFLLDNIYLLLISRAILGIATAFLMTGVGILLSDYYKGEEREKALAMQFFFMAFSGAVFLILGGYLANLDWRYPFLVYLLGFLIFIFAKVQLFEPDKIQSNPSKDQKNSFNFNKFIFVYALSIISMGCFYIAPTQLSFFMIHHLQIQQSSIGISMAIASIAMAISSFYYQKLHKTFSIYEIFFIALSLLGGGFAVIGLLHNYFSILLGFLLLGLSLGLLNVNNSTWLFSLAEEKERPRAYGFLTSSMFAGQFISPLITQTIVYHIGLVEMIGIVAIFVYFIGFIFLYLSKKRKGNAR
ncbi:MULTISPECIES: MFS transporter [unclassified Helicobacter]|uniref:MFS transporter n=1 Tax=unclassified Helicobacter TaxID=2593540 RepID=UPI000CF19D09|nr:MULTISPECIES: MFS transporter [unclassified Helicobacter]